MRTSNAQHRTPNLEPREMERAMSADYDLEEYAHHPNGLSKKAVARQASRFDVRCSALDVRSSFLAYPGSARRKNANIERPTSNAEPRTQGNGEGHECYAYHPNGRAQKAVARQASRFDVRCSALDVRSSFLAYPGNARRKNANIERPTSNAEPRTQGNGACYEY